MIIIIIIINIIIIIIISHFSTAFFSSLHWAQYALQCKRKTTTKRREGKFDENNKDRSSEALFTETSFQGQNEPGDWSSQPEGNPLTIWGAWVPAAPGAGLPCVTSEASRSAWASGWARTSWAGRCSLPPRGTCTSHTHS